MDYFELLGVEKDFDVDLSQLEKNYFSLQKQFHPDRYNNSSDAEKVTVMQKAADINVAYNTLKDEISRAEYLIESSGRKVKGDEAGRDIDIEILEESMHFREQLEFADSIEQIVKVENSASTKKETGLKDLREKLGAQDYDSAKSIFLRLKYFEKLLNEIKLKKLSMEKTLNVN